MKLPLRPVLLSAALALLAGTSAFAQAGKPGVGPGPGQRGGAPAFKPGGTITLTDGTVVTFNADGTITVGTTVIKANADGTISLPDGTVIKRNADGSFTLPDGTVLNPPRGGRGPGG